MRHNMIETVMGAIVLGVAVVFFMFAMKTSQFDRGSGYDLNAAFANANGLVAGSDVRVGGVKVGSVSSLSLDAQSYQAVAHLKINDGISLPKDTSATIRSESLMGGKYLALEPGGDDVMLKNGGRIEYTQSTPDLEQMLGQAIFSMSGAAKKDAEKSEMSDRPSSETATPTSPELSPTKGQP